MKAKSEAAVACAAVALTAAACMILGHARQGDEPVSLTFERYSDLEPYVGDVAFLRLTNASNKSYLLTMTGNTNTFVFYNWFGRIGESWMVNCEFSDQTPTGRTNWSQQPSPVTSSNAYAELAPHSAIVIRVPVPPDGQRRRVAALYQPTASGWRQSRFWSTPFGLAMARILVRTLPKSELSKVANPRAVWLKAWYGTELTNHCSEVGNGAS
jgi:hypothetical protein